MDWRVQLNGSRSYGRNAREPYGSRRRHSLPVRASVATRNERRTPFFATINNTYVKKWGERNDTTVIVDNVDEALAEAERAAKGIFGKWHERRGVDHEDLPIHLCIDPGIGRNVRCARRHQEADLRRQQLPQGLPVVAIHATWPDRLVTEVPLSGFAATGR